MTGNGIVQFVLNRAEKLRRFLSGRYIVSGVLAAAAWAYYKVLSTPKETEYLGSPTPPLPENAEE